LQLVGPVALLGYSSGGPNAMAAACRMPGLGRPVSALGLISSDAPYSDMGPEMVKSMYGAETVTQEHALTRTQHSAQEMKEGYESMSKPDRKEIALADLANAVKQGCEGPAQDSVLEAGQWDFSVAEITVPTLMWHGDQDKDVPMEAALYLQEQIGPGLHHSTMIQGENHTLIRRHWKNILTEIVALAKASTASL